MPIRVLGEVDAAMFRELRVRALRDHPEAFGRTPDEVDLLAMRFSQDVDSISTSCSAPLKTGLFAVAGCRRERFVKHRHVAYIWGVYVARERRGTGLGRTIVRRVTTWSWTPAGDVDDVDRGLASARQHR